VEAFPDGLRPQVDTQRKVRRRYQLIAHRSTIVRSLSGAHVLKELLLLHARENAERVLHCRLVDFTANDYSARTWRLVVEREAFDADALGQ
jgi:hypothetical protein